MDNPTRWKTSKAKILLGMLLFYSSSLFAQTADDEKLLNMCKACHGDNGSNQFHSIPELKWQNSQYMLAQLIAFKNGQRNDPTMEKVAKLLSKKQMEIMAAYFQQGNSQQKENN